MADEISIKAKVNKLKRFIIITASVVVVLTMGAVIFVMSKSTTAKKVEKQLSLGAKYLSELDYEQAIVAYELAIKIDPKNTDAYLAMADIYIARGDFDKAEEILKEAQSVVDEENLRRIEEKREEVKRKKKEEVEPVVASTPTVAPTVTPKPQVDLNALPVMSGPGDVSYTINDMTYYDSWWETHIISDDGAITLQFEQIYGEIRLVLPHAIDMSKCNGLTVKLNDSGKAFGVKLYDSEFKEVYAGYTEGIQGITEVYLVPDLNIKVTGIGLMTCDENANISNVESTVYSVTFHMNNHETLTNGMVRYDFDDVKYNSSYWTNYEINDEGTISLQYEKIYAEIRFFLPQMIEIDRYTEVAVKMKSEVGNLAIKLYDKDFNEIYASYDGMTYGVEEKRFTPGTNARVAGIGLMACDDGMTDYSMFEAMVYSMTFYVE